MSVLAEEILQVYLFVNFLLSLFYCLNLFACLLMRLTE